MLIKPANWDSIEGKERGEYINLPPGAYKCIISDAEIKVSKKGEQMLVLYLEIAEGLYQGHFAELPKWRSAFYQITVGDGESYFKGLINAIENSNPSYRLTLTKNR